jgi:sigma-B regulation protein RsbU (phosphoserine phosphatase)
MSRTDFGQDRGQDRAHSRILVVDDDPGMRRAIERVLAAGYDVASVEGASEAMALLERQEFDLALVDVRLKDGDGYSLCQAIRARRPETDVILITGSISEPDEKLFRSLEEGAFYFLFKPFDRRVLLALVERCLRLQRERETSERYARELAADLEKARLFQHSLLPSEPVAAAGWRVEGRLLSCDALGGDFYTAQTVDAGVACAVADVVGHGVSAAMYAGMLRSTLDAARRRGTEPEGVGRGVLRGIDFFRGAACATMVYALLLPDGRVRYLSAGHPPLFWLKGDGSVEPLSSTGPLLHWLFHDRTLPVREVSLEPGDRLLAFTDGTFEARSPADQELGLDRLEEAFKALSDRLMGKAVDALMDLVLAFCDGRPVVDDVTVVMIERER